MFSTGAFCDYCLQLKESCLSKTQVFKVLDELSDILYRGGYCNLNQSDNCKRGMAIIQRKLTDCDIISRAINESDKLNPADKDG